MKKPYLFFLAALFAASPILAQSITTSPLTVGPIPANFGSAYQNIPFTGNVTNSGVIGGVPPYVCSKVSGSFPAGIADVTVGCVVAGTPTGTGSSTEVVKIADSGNSTVILSITVNVATLSTINASSTTATILTGSQLQLSCPSTWSDNAQIDLTKVATWFSGNTGVLTVNSGGAFPGLATGISGGSANVTCTFNSTTSANLAITVTSSNPVTVSTTSLPNCQQNLSYQSPTGFQLTATGGAPPYTWTQTGGTLPTGLSLTSGGLILGTCTGSTASSLVFKATDTASANGSSGSLTLTVATLSSISVTPTTPTINAGAQQQFTATGTYSDNSTANLSNGSSGLALINTATSGSSGATTGTSSVTPAFAAIAGDTFWVACSHGTDTTTTCTPTDTAGNTFTAITTKTNAPVGFVETFYAKNITGNSADVLTCTYNNSVAFRSCSIHQIVGASTSAPLDSASVVSANSSTPSNAATTPSFSTATANEVEDVAYMIDSSTTTVTAGIGYTLRVNAQSTGTEDQTFSNTQSSVTASASWTGSALDWVIIGQAFEAAVSGNGCKWTSSSLGIAITNASGLTVAGTGNGGTTTIQCTVGAVNGSTVLTVNPSAITSLTLSPTSGSIGIGSQISFTCTDNLGNNVTPSATFGSNNSSVFSFGTPNGTGTGVAAGSAQVTCSKSGLTSNAATIDVSGSGNTFTAASCNTTDVNSVINGPAHTAIDGDTIQIPAGSCTWTTGVTIPSNIGITIIGSGTPNNSTSTFGAASSCSATSITAPGASAYTLIVAHGPTVGNSTLRISCMNITRSGNGAAFLSILGSCTTSGCPNLRMDNITFTGWTNPNAQNRISYGINAVGDMFGVMDHNSVLGAGTNNYLALVEFSNASYLMSGGQYGDNAWALPEGYGTANFLFIENNLFQTAGSSENEGDANGLTTRGGGRIVVRYNQFTAMQPLNFWVGWHGTETSGRPRSTRVWEAYGNVGQCANGPDASHRVVCTSIVAARGGTGLTWGNSYQSTAPGNSILGAVTGLGNNRIAGAPAVPWYACDGSKVFDKNDGVTYFSGTIGSFTTGSTTSGTAPGTAAFIITVGGTSPGWTTNQWVGYSVHDTTQLSPNGTGSEILQSGANTLYVGNEGGPGPYIPVANDAIQILRATACIDQPGGRGQGFNYGGLNPPSATPSNQAVSPTYTWMNSYSGPGVNPGSEVSVYPPTSKMQNNRDFYTESINQTAQTSATSPFNGSSGTGYGTLANRPTTCTANPWGSGTGVGYWETDNLQFDFCTATNTWSTLTSSPASYKPFTYPHPLITGGGGGNSPGISFTPASINFNNVNVGGSPGTQLVTINNPGTANTIITAIASSGTNLGDFSFTSTSCSAVPILIAPGTSCTITISFTPATTGTRSGFMNFTDNAAGSPQQIALSGTGSTAGAGVSVAGHYLNTSLCGGSVSSCTIPTAFTVHNTGDAVKVTFGFCVNTSCNAAPAGTFTVTDGTNTYTQVAAASMTPANFDLVTFVATNATAGSYSIKITASTDLMSFSLVDIQDLAGANTSNAVDSAVSNTVVHSTSIRSITSAGNVTNANEVILVTAMCQSQSSITNTGTYTTLDSASGVATMDLVHPSAGATTTSTISCPGTGAPFNGLMVGITP